MNIETRFWAKVIRKGEDECWGWNAATTNGYGVLKLTGQRKNIGAHRFSWELHNGMSAPEDMEVMHSCDNPPCCNPSHLSLGTHVQNMKQIAIKGRQPTGDTHGRSKLKTVDVRFIRHWIKRGCIGKHISDAFGVTHSAITGIKNGYRWAKLP